ncbi:hypothetical protein NWE57_05840 [Mycoplasmopsis cynos]|nr:hypothetical protein [Mycoplasmopsis cynos]UWV92354.1 hypothetical protein NWE57_05840 [Mycoplasmopsis cynos]
MLMYNANINAFDQLQNKEDGAINYGTIEDFKKIQIILKIKAFV